MKPFIFQLNRLIAANYLKHLSVVACCCGHGKYPMTVVMKNNSLKGKLICFDLISGKDIPRKRRFYRRDKRGYYFIPEALK